MGDSASYNGNSYRERRHDPQRHQHSVQPTSSLLLQGNSGRSLNTAGTDPTGGGGGRRAGYNRPTTPESRSQFVPPGFDRVGYDTSSPEFDLSEYGVAIRANAGSAPPPGFHDSLERQRQNRVDQAAAMLLHPYHRSTSQDGSEMHHGYDVSYEDDSKRTTSFVNLAAALGKGLAESMDESFRDREDALADPRGPLPFPQSKYPGGAMGNPYHASANVYHASRVSEQAAAPSIGPASVALGATDDAALNLQRAASSDSRSRKTMQQPQGYLLSPAQFEASNNPTSLGRAQASPPAAHELNNYQRQSRHSASRLIGKTPQNSAPAEITEPFGYTAQPQFDDDTRRIKHHTSVVAPQPVSSLAMAAGFTAKQPHKPTNDRLRNNNGSHADEMAPPQPTRSLSNPMLQRQQALQNEFPVAVHGVSRSSTPSSCSESLPPSQAHTPRSRTPEVDYDSHTTCSSDSAVRQAMAKLEREYQAEKELIPFLRNTNQTSGTPTRGLVILGVATLLSVCETVSVQDIRSTCEAFGTLDSFRGDFAASRGVIFLSYYDLRAAQYAGMELAGCLYRLAASEGVTSTKAVKLKVKHCTPLNSSSATDESTILLSNLPREMDEDRLAVIMGSYGAVKAVHYQLNTDSSRNSNSDEEELPSYVVEFFDIQDAKQALLELESMHPWGPNVEMEMGMRNPSKRRKGRELLALIGTWRHGKNASASNKNTNALSTPAAQPNISPRIDPAKKPSKSSAPTTNTIPHLEESSCSSSSPKPNLPSVIFANRNPPSGPNTISHPHPQSSKAHHPPPGPVHPQQVTRLAVTPDGQYTYVIVNQPPTLDTQQGAGSAQQPTMIQHGPPGTYFTAVPVHASHNSFYPSAAAPHHQHAHPNQHYSVPTHHIIMPAGATPAYFDARQGVSYPFGVPATLRHTVVSGNDNTGSVAGDTSVASGSSNRSGRKGHKHHSSNELVDERNLVLDLQAVKNGVDKRTSLMVRNIPNKYTQKMLLAEFAECGNGSDKIDFFYLPIDFKNKCNRGYAFVNFVDYRDIINFHLQYNGKNWKIFNSDKICDITYARIQGKAAMLKRFEHSALLDKEDDYRPLVFVSHGENKGRREAFPGQTHGSSDDVTSLGNVSVGNDDNLMSASQR